MKTVLGFLAGKQTLQDFDRKVWVRSRRLSQRNSEHFNLKSNEIPKLRRQLEQAKEALLLAEARHESAKRDVAAIWPLTGGPNGAITGNDMRLANPYVDDNTDSIAREMEARYRDDFTLLYEWHERL